jgi:hypothetical protein
VDSGVDFTLGSSEEAQEGEQKTRRKRKQVRLTANPRSTPAPRKKNHTARSSSKEVRHIGESEQIRSGRTERKPASRGLELAAHHHETLAGVSRERGEGERREEATVVAFIGHGFRDGEGWKEVSLLPREPAKANCRRHKSPQNRPPSTARSRALELQCNMAYERSQAEGAVLPLAGQAGGGERGSKHENGLLGV